MGDSNLDKGIATLERNENIIVNNTKEYIKDSKILLDNLKNIQYIIGESTGNEIPFLINVAKTNLTKTSIDQCKNMIIELQLNFNENGIVRFIEKTVAIVTSAETANLIYGNLINIEKVRRYLSNKTYNIVLLRTKKLLEQLKSTKYEDSLKLAFIVENLKLCNKIFEYCWDIYPSNILSLEQTIVTLNELIKHRVKLGLDNYNVELIKVMISKNEQKILDLTPNEYGVVNREIKSTLDESLVIKEVNIITDLVCLEINSDLCISISSKNDATDQFIEISNNVLRDITESASNDFLSIAFQKFYSIISSMETVNYLNGDVLDKNKISLNISNILTEMIYSNYGAISESLNNIENKSEEDYIAYSREILSYSKMLYEAYEMNKTNLDALYKCIEIKLVLYKNKYNFKLTNEMCDNIKRSIDMNLPLLKDVKPELTYEIEGHKELKRKSFWSKIFK